MRVESSIITSLSELRAIEQQRIADERAALERERRAEVEARETAERTRREAEEARVRAEREELMRIEQARVDAEREARMRVQAMEAAERARHVAALEEQRLAQEMELRRAEVAKKRPTWMLVVTGMAFAAAIALAAFAIESAADRDVAQRGLVAANDATRKAQEDARLAREELKILELEMERLDAQVAKAQASLAAAQTRADREAAAELIREANRQRVLVRKQHEDARAREEAAARAAGFDASKCLHGALDCIDGKPKKKK